MKTKRILLTFALGIVAILAVALIPGALSGAVQAQSDGPTAPVPLAAQGGKVTLELMGQVGGTIQDVTVQGNYAYLCVGPRLLILDISNPANPTLAGQTEVLTGTVGAVDVVEDYAYLVTGDGLRVVSVADPANPTPVGHYRGLGGHDVHVVGDYAYLAEYSTLRVISITNPISPTEVGYYGGRSMYGVQVAGDYAYIAGTSSLPDTTYQSGLVIISLADRAHPTEVGFHEAAGFPEDVHIAGDYVYLASTSGFIDFEGHLEVFSLDNPGNPSPMGAVTIAPSAWGSSYASGVHVVGDYAYVSTHYSGMAVVSVANKANPTELGHLDTPGRAYGVAVSGDYAYVADDWGGLRVISVVNRNNPSEASSYVPGAAGWVGSIHVVGDYAYLGGGYSGLWVVSVADSENPSRAGYAALSGGFDYIEDVYAVGDYVYAADVLNGLKVFSVADKANPTLVGEAATVEGGESVYAAGNYAYLATRNDTLPDPEAHPSGLRIFSVADPSHPTQEGVYETTGGARGVHVVGNYAYLAVWPPDILQPGQLEVVSVANPRRPSQAGFYESTLLKPYDIQVVGNNAYMATTWGLWTFSVSDPNSPESLGSEYGDGAKSVHVVGNYAYLARDGVSVVSTTDPAHPTEVGSYRLGDYRDIYTAGETVYVAGGQQGLFVLRIVQTSSISGQVLDGRGRPSAGIQISAGSAYSATTNASGVYTLTVPADVYTLTPTTPGYFWSPEARTVTVPPDASGQDFVGRNIQKQVTPSSYQGTVGLSDRLTYTLRLIYPESGSLALYDPLPPYTYTRYVSGSLNAPGLVYHSDTHAISGTLDVTAGELVTVTFAVQVEVMGTAGFAPTIVNQACIHLPGEGLADCEWSNQVINYTYVWPVYLPIVMR